MRRRSTSSGASSRPVASATGAPTDCGTAFATAAPMRYATYDGETIGRVRDGCAAPRAPHDGRRRAPRSATASAPGRRRRSLGRRWRAREEARSGGQVGRLAPHLHEAVHRGDRHEHDHDPEHRHQHVEREPDAEQHHALGALHEPAARVVAESLGLGALVGDQHRERDRREREHRAAAAVAAEVPGDATEDDRVRHAVGDGVEERAARRGAARGARDRAVEEVDDPARGQADDGPHEVPGRDEQRREHRQSEPQRGQTVGSDAGALETASDGRESTRHRGAQTAVEHGVRHSLRRRERREEGTTRPPGQRSWMRT